MTLINCPQKETVPQYKRQIQQLKAQLTAAVEALKSRPNQKEDASALPSLATVASLSPSPTRGDGEDREVVHLPPIQNINFLATRPVEKPSYVT